jgi:hypothetical protein
LVSLSNPGGDKAIFAVETWQSLSKKFQTTPSAAKQMASVFWGMEAIVLIECLIQG